MSIDFKNYTIKDYITIISFVLSGIGLYYRLEAKTDSIDSKVQVLEKNLEKFNPEAVQVDIGYIKRDIQKLDGKLEKILDRLEERAPSTHKE